MYPDGSETLLSEEQIGVFCRIEFSAATGRLPNMKHALTYGFYMALAGAFLVLGLYFAGLHEDAAKMSLGQNIGMIGGVAISVVVMLMGVREKRNLTPADKKWGYGSAFGTAFLIGFFGSLITTVFNYAYFFHINPGFSELVFQTELAKLEAQGVAQDVIDGAEPMLKMMTSSSAMVITGAIFGVIGNGLIALMIAAFCKNRPEVATPPVV